MQSLNEVPNYAKSLPYLSFLFILLICSHMIMNNSSIFVYVNIKLDFINNMDMKDTLNYVFSCSCRWVVELFRVR